MIKGIDISKWNQVTNWNALEKSQDFVILKAGGGDNGIYIDRNFKNNIKNASRHFNKIGIYWYVGGSTKNTILKEVDYLIDLLKAVEKQDIHITLPVFLDIETKALYNNTECQTITKIALSKLEAAGYFAGLYTYQNFFKTRFNEKFYLRFYTWIADYRKNATQTYTSNYKSKSGNYFKALQYGQENVAGVQGKVDVNYMFDDPSKIIAKKKFNHIK